MTDQLDELRRAIDGHGDAGAEDATGPAPHHGRQDTAEDEVAERPGRDGPPLPGSQAKENRKLDRQDERTAQNDLGRVGREPVGDPETAHVQEENPRCERDPFNPQSTDSAQLIRGPDNPAGDRQPPHRDREGVPSHHASLVGAFSIDGDLRQK